ncbi:hypothetical protein [Candidatus Chloroploca asiatica]|uniref:Uncharacterized protein n=1 Tax=Candidatus Chloroploca asiatica TaxID=1506545 RepID=A0A2H3KHQ3_9CHLR|nr:hypothetical protein [Candidatus Chloroploca asiatica]PDV97303.1 hypothetical protein A9Q02_18955 [Candidatus Chloroploca asiatica]
MIRLTRATGQRDDHQREQPATAMITMYRHGDLGTLGGLIRSPTNLSAHYAPTQSTQRTRHRGGAG